MAKPTAGAAPLHVFVYGTLRAGEINDIHAAAARHGLPAPQRIGSPVAVPGRLYDFGAYPGMVEDSQAGPVKGDIYAIDARLVPVLDAIEEIDNGLFLKRWIEIVSAGQRYTCLFYPVNAASVATLARIGAGDWIGYRVARDRTPVGLSAA